jgi:diaminopimelate epimerase
MHYCKYHGLGNDYIIIDPSNINITPGAANIKLICDRHYGIGSDGILYGPLFKNGIISVRIFNPDGSEAEKSGNGVRIFSSYLFEKGYVKEKMFYFLTKGGRVDIEILDDHGRSIRVNMGEYTFDSDKIPVAGRPRRVINEEIEISGVTYHMTCVSLGNPHCVVPVERATERLARKLGPRIESHPLFPNRINVQLLEAADRNTIKIQIWERGTGYTLASGSSSCAAALAAHKLGIVGNNVNVKMPGGLLLISIDDRYVHLTGPVAKISEGNFSAEFIEEINKAGV